MRSGLEAGGAPVMWERAVLDLLPEMRSYVPKGSCVLELGYGDGELSCFLARELGWEMDGLDIDPHSQCKAIKNAEKYGLTDRLRFHCCEPADTMKHCGQYDAVFIKTVLYSSRSRGEYAAWLNWILSVLKPGGILIDFETGRANSLVQAYRRLRNRVYADLCLYTSAVEPLYDERFEILARKYYGGISQFFAPVPVLYRFLARLEEYLRPGNADNCFIVSVIGRKPRQHQ